MKKIILIAVAVLGFVVTAAAQPRAIGVRLGNGGEVSYQHTVGKDFVEVDGGLGLNLYDGNSLNVGATAIYNFMIAQPQWTDRGEWGFYAGPGATVGLGLGDNAHFNLAAAGMVGLEYSFWFPLQLSIDFRQHIGFGFGHGLYFPSSIGLGVRYRF
jgi:hypothetical protein